MSGRVIQRRFPCLKPKVLVLTDLPRLLVMDYNGRRLLHDVNLAAESPSSVSSDSTCVRECLNDPALQVENRTEFRLCLGGLRLRCRDHDLGSEAWVEQIAAARRHVLGQQNGAAAAGSV
eukprot:gb/GFBE01000225.1/.p1 GENE.gb/GFBE01000225.1/~~gb/GFBE01000225.1/.p1  ORF type:complete len:120 (+),score=17.08 gb/GFBE01000225.1/:1-360(+)